MMGRFESPRALLASPWECGRAGAASPWPLWSGRGPQAPSQFSWRVEQSAPVVSRYHQVGGFARPQGGDPFVLLMAPVFLVKEPYNATS